MDHLRNLRTLFPIKSKLHFWVKMITTDGVLSYPKCKFVRFLPVRGFSSLRSIRIKIRLVVHIFSNMVPTSMHMCACAEREIDR